MKKTLAGFKTQLEAELKRTSDRAQQGWRLGRWWAKQRMAWLLALKQHISSFSFSLQENEALMHWRPTSIWLKIFSFFDLLFYQVNAQLRKIVRCPVKEIEQLRKNLVAYGQQKHRGTHPHCLTGEVISGRYTHFEWIKKLGIEEHWVEARQKIAAHAQDFTPSMQKYRRLVYFARAQKEIMAFSQTRSLPAIQLDNNALCFFKELYSFVEEAKKHGDTSRGINMLGSLIRPLGIALEKKVTPPLQSKPFSEQSAWLSDQRAWHHDLKQQLEETDKTLLSPATLKRLAFFDKASLVKGFKQAKQAYQAALEDFFEKAHYATWPILSDDAFLEAKVQHQAAFFILCHDKARAYEEAQLALIQGLADIDEEICQSAVIMRPLALSSSFTQARPVSAKEMQSILFGEAVSPVTAVLPQAESPSPAAASSTESESELRVKVDARLRAICQRWGVPVDEEGKLSLKELKKHHHQWALKTHTDRRRSIFPVRFNELQFQQGQVELTLLADWLRFELKDQSALSHSLRRQQKEEKTALLVRLGEAEKKVPAYSEERCAVLDADIANFDRMIREDKRRAAAARAAAPTPSIPFKERVFTVTLTPAPAAPRAAVPPPPPATPFKEKVFTVTLTPAPAAPQARPAKPLTPFKERVIAIKTVNTTPESPHVLPRSASTPTFFKAAKPRASVRRRSRRRAKRSQSQIPTWKNP